MPRENSVFGEPPPPGHRRPASGTNAFPDGYGAGGGSRAGTPNGPGGRQAPPVAAPGGNRPGDGGRRGGGAHFPGSSARETSSAEFLHGADAWPPPSHGDLTEAEDPGKRGKPRRNWKQRLLLTGLVGVMLVSLAGIGAAAWGIHTLGRIERIDDVALDQVVEGDPINYLIIGSDTRGEGDEIGGQRADSMVVFRVDPENEQAAVVTFPRDLMVPLSVDGEFDPNGSPQQLNHAYSSANGRDDLAETLRKNFGIPIHHFIEINFEGFQQLIDSVGGIEVYVDRAMRDTDSGLHVEELGCVNMDGATALSFVRSRHLEILGEDGEWTSADGYADLGRGTRQREFIQQAVGKALREAPTNPNQMRQTVESLADTVAIDETLSLSTLSGLADTFRDLDANDEESFRTFQLPLDDDPDDANRVVLRELEAEPILNVFRGLPEDEVGPGAIEVSVLNGTGAEDEATNVAGAFQEIGFDIGTPGDWEGETPMVTTVFHRPGEENLGMRVARHVTGSVWVQEGEGLEPGEVEVVTGASFETLHETPTDPEDMGDTKPPDDLAGTSDADAEESGSEAADSDGNSSGGDDDASDDDSDDSGPSTTAPKEPDLGYAPGGSCA